MNNKDEELMRIMDNTIKCCSVMDNDGIVKVTRDVIIGKDRKENISMVRTMVACQIYAAGYTVSTISVLLKRTPQAIRHLLEKGFELSSTSRAYRIAENQATSLNRQASL